MKIKGGKSVRRSFLYVTLTLCIGFYSNIWATTYTYDGLNRLVKVEYDSGTIIEYEYDDAGNIVKVTTISKKGEVIENDESKKEQNNKTNVSIKSEENKLSHTTSEENTSQENRQSINEIQESEENTNVEIDAQETNNHVVMKLNDFKMIVNDQIIEMDVKMFISKSNRLMVPVRYVAYALGIDSDQIIWSSKEKSITIQGKKEVKLFVGKEYMLVDGQVIQLNEQVQIINGRTYLPIGDLCKCFEVQYSWDNIKKQLTIG